ncbi:MAG: sulfotransferase family 2 domain-containing protein [Planctomycetales bacterium]|nr:sulfotransferase family 2 domain-containing protein [Planctomycetales bacterium]
MIISHKYKFIFLKTRKTAGTSIEIALSKFCGEKDIITPITPEDEDLRKNLGYRGPQNYAVSYTHYSLNDWYRKMIYGAKIEFYNHIPAFQVRQWIGEKVWNSYYKFCFERNPWDKVISLYYFSLSNSCTTPSFEEYIKKESEDAVSNYRIYTIGNRLAVDDVYLFENLNDELAKIAKKTGLPETLILPRAKSRFRKDKRPYREIIGQNEKEYIQKICQKEIDLFGYSFE